MQGRRRVKWMLGLSLMAFALGLMELLSGSVTLTTSEVFAALAGSPTDELAHDIIWYVRLPQAITAALAGAGLALCGAVMQTLFRNPLAGPGVLGISSGAGLGVALVVLAGPMLPALPIPTDLLLVVASVAGALAVLLLILAVDGRVGDGAVLLIVGVMVGYICSSLVSVLQASSAAMQLKQFVSWGLGSFAGVPLHRLPWLAVPVSIGCVASLMLVKPLNALLLGDDHARSVGVQVGRVRRWAILIAGLLTGTITAFCGPVAFLGLATPHIARWAVRTSEHGTWLPVTTLFGAVLALACDLVVRSNDAGALPLNAVTSLVGAPVVLWVLLGGRRWGQRERA